MSVSETCAHCNLPIPPADLVIDVINGKERHFCCQGCQGVYRIISGAGLLRFYNQREWLEQGVPQGVFETTFEESALAGHIKSHNETSSEIALIIEGIRCASCVWLLENLLSKEQGITKFLINYGTHRALIKFNPQLTSPARIFSSISRLGYLPHPFTPGMAQQAAAREQRSLLIRFGTAAFLSMQLMGFSFALYGGYFHGIDPGIRLMIQYLAAIVTTPVVFYSGWPFLTGAWRSLKNRSSNMDMLIALGVLSAFFYSIYAMLTGGEVYFDTAAMIITLILVGRLFEGSARNRSIAGIDRLLRLAPDSANRIDQEEINTVASASLIPGDLILVRPGELIPVDSVIQDGETELDESTITGESMPVLRKPGDHVTAGILNLSTSIKLRVERIAAESFVARMARMVEEAQSRKAPIQTMADTLARHFVPLVALVATGTAFFWLFKDVPPSNILLNSVSVLIVACPCALGLATPTAILAASGNAAARGILFRGGDILEITGRINLVAFDKTGTLTLGKPTVTKVLPAPGYKEEDLLRLASQVECGSNHPIALAVINKAKAHGIVPKIIDSVETVPGRGLRMTGEAGEILIGSRTFLVESGVQIPYISPGNSTEVYVALGGSWCGALLIKDNLRTEAIQAVKLLQNMGLQTVLLSGDRSEAVEEISTKLSINDFLANLSPADKAAWITDQQQSGQRILMVGDGINDTPALSSADVGCAMAGGTDIALETSDLVLTRPSLVRLYEAVFIGRETIKVIKQNLFWAITYNLVTIPLAASGNLAPVWAAVAMASSSLLVVSNSLRLGRLVRRKISVAKVTVKN